MHTETVIQKPDAIYIVDDNQLEASLLKKMINVIRDDIKVRIFFDGKKALRYLVTHEWDQCPAVLLDLDMPYFSGWDFLEAYSTRKQRGSKAQIYIHTGYDDSALQIRAQRFGEVKGYFVKPIPYMRMRHVIRDILGG